jgi:protein gp37
MAKTTIEWTDHSLNPLRARAPNGKSGHHCVKVSPGCKNCYSSRFQPRLGLPVFQEQRSDPPTLFLDAKTLLEPLTRRKPTKFFWCDMTDMFGEWVPFEWIAACFGVMAATPRHTHQVLTKRPARALEFFDWLDAQLVSNGGPTVNAARGARWHTWQHIDDFKVYDEAQPWIWPLPNVWLGVSVEDQKRANERIPLLLRCPATVRFLSCEPLLGPVDLSASLHIGRCRSIGPKPERFRCGLPEDHDGHPHSALHESGAPWFGTKPVDWVIVGGESGAGARPMQLDWMRSIVEQCRDAGTACFVKQFGACPMFSQTEGYSRAIRGEAVRLLDRKGGDLSEIPGEWPREFPR